MIYIYISTPSPSFLFYIYSSPFTSPSSKTTTTTILSLRTQMGICSSCDATSVSTAKLILNDGRLEEFSYPVKVSYVLQRNPSCFICNSDEMDFDDIVSAIHEDEELQPGQLYFALPLSRLRQPLQAEEMAALAVKASSALMKGGGGEKCRCRRKSISPEIFTVEKGMKSSGRVSPGGGEFRRGRNSGDGGRRNLTRMLSSIPE